MLLLPAAGTAHAEEIRVAVDAGRTGPRVEQRFLGLSFEASALPQLARGGTRGNLVRLLRSLGPGVMRFGGASLDASTAFSITGRAPPWATTVITPRDLRRLGILARRSGWQVLLGLPLGHYQPRRAALEARIAARQLGPALAAVEIGNEPDAFWYFGLRSLSWGYPDYRREIRSYRRALAAIAPGVPLAGPDTVLPEGVGWLAAYARDERPALLTPHFYPHHGCFGPRGTVEELLGPALAQREAERITAFGAIARAHGLPMRIGETNNVPCGGQTGVSDTFGAALWALRYMLRIADSGIAGVNFHTLPETCRGYSPICAPTQAGYDRVRLRPMPEWYALLLFRHLVGRRSVHVSLSRKPEGLTVGAFRGPSDGAVDVVAVNTHPHAPARLVIRAGLRHVSPWSVLRLTAPALDATTEVRLRRHSRRRGNRVFRTSIPGGGAALVRIGR